MSKNFKVRGLIDMERQFRTLPDKIGANILDNSVEGMAQIVEDEAESLAPRRTGKLRRNVSRARQKGTDKDRKQWNVGVRKRVYYWRYQELGTSRNAAHPFLRPAAYNKAKEALAEFRKRFQAGLKQVTR